ncbi:MAG: hypothetical protein GY788_32395, partial [bacterium]|nr:hypothetical protein [bacterium]
MTATNYVVLDAVERGGSSYVCKLAHTAAAANEPGVGASWSTYWDLAAEKGEDGADGLGSGDMLKSDYDPGNIIADAFDADNHLDGTTKVVMTLVERNKLAAIEASATADQTGSEIKVAYEAQGDTNAYTDAAKTKVDQLTVTQPVDLDAIETRVNALDAAVVLMGAWDASAGTFPGGGSAQAGESWLVSVAGTVDVIEFSVNDRIIAITDNASTTTYADIWQKADYSDKVEVVAGQTGNISAPALRTAINVEDG